MGYSIDILNNIRANASMEYQQRIPQATQDNISNIGQAFANYEVLFNEFHNALVNKIGRTILESKMFENKLARFKNGGVVSPHDVEEIFVEMAKAEGSYDPNATNVFGRRQGPDVYAIYHRENRQDKYVITIGDLDVLKVFRSEATLDSFITAKINSVYSADSYDEWLCMKELFLKWNNEKGFFEYRVPYFEDEPDKEKWGKTFVKTVRKAVQDLSFPSKEYNYANVMTWTDPSDMVLLVNKDVLVEVDVEMLARAFNRSDTDLKVVPTIISMDDFGGIGDTYAMLVDKDWFRIYDTLIHMEPARNPDGLFTNYFFHHHQILSASTFKNAVKFNFVN